MEEHKFGSAVKKWALILSIIVVLNLFFNYGIYTFYKAPKYENYCDQKLGSVEYVDRLSCEAGGGVWNANAYPKAVPAEVSQTQPQGYCDVYYQCNKDFQVVNAVYNRNVFIILFILGVLSLVGGLFLKSSVAVSLGFSFGGVISLIVGSVRYWADMQDYLQFILLGLALAILVWLGIKKFND